MCVLPSASVHVLVSGINGKIHEVEQENSAVEAAHKTEIAAETAARHFCHHRESSVNKPYEKVSKLEHKADVADAKLNMREISRSILR